MRNLSRLKELRREKKLTQTEIGEMLEVTLRQYQRYEHGDAELSIDGWIFLADFYNVSLDYLVGRSDRRERQ